MMRFFRSLYRNETAIDFPRLWRPGLMLSAGLIVLSVILLFARGLNLGLEFEGGAAWEVPNTDEVSVGDVRDVMADFGFEDARIQTAGDLLTVRAEVDAADERVAEIAGALAELTGSSVEDVTTTVVGPSWGDEVTDKAVRALVIFFIVIAVYITLRLQWKMALATLIAVAHDIVLTVGIYSLFHFSVTPATVIAFLTIMGYSLYDTLVVFDRARDNEHRMSGGKFTYREIMNVSLNQVLARSLNTSIASLLPVVAVLVVGDLILGGATLADFAIALFVGLLLGALSSVFIAAPIAVWLKEREHRWQEIAAKAAGRSEPVSRAVLAGAGQGASTTARPAAAASARTPAGAIPPRPRKQKRRH